MSNNDFIDFDFDFEDQENGTEAQKKVNDNENNVHKRDKEYKQKKKDAKNVSNKTSKNTIKNGEVDTDKTKGMSKESKKEKKEQERERKKIEKEWKKKNKEEQRASKKNKSTSDKGIETGNKDRNNKVKIAIIVISAISVIVVAVILVSILGNRDKFELLIAEDGAYKENTVKSDIYHKNDRVSTTIETDESTIEAEVNDNIEDREYRIREFAEIPIKVNTKLQGEDEYKDYTSYVQLGMVDVVSGYDSVSEYVSAYNDTTNDKINLPEKEEFYSGANGLEIVAYIYEIRYADDYPTYESKGYVFKIPKLSMKIYGKYSEETIEANEGLSPYENIVAGDSIYNIQNIVDVSVIETQGEGEDERINVNDVIQFVFITSVPNGIAEDNYGIEIELFEDKENLEKAFSKKLFAGVIVGDTNDADVSDGDETLVETEDNTGEAENIEDNGDEIGTEQLEE